MVHQKVNLRPIKQKKKRSYYEYSKDMVAYGDRMVTNEFQKLHDPDTGAGRKAWTGLIIVFVIIVIVGVAMLLVFCIVYSIKYIKGSVQYANSNGLNPIQWLKDPIGSLKNFFSYVTESWQNLGTAVLDGVFLYLLFESGGFTSMMALTAKII